MDRGSEDDAARGDPLAELARLIGQNDPYADLGQRSARPSGRTDWRPGNQDAPAPPGADPGFSDWRKTAAALARESMRASSLDSHRGQPEAAQEVDPYQARPDDRFTQPAGHQFAHPTAPIALHDEGNASYRYEEAPPFGAPQERLQTARGSEPPAAATGDEELYVLDGAETPADDRFYDDPPQKQRRSGLVTALVLIGCAMAGTAGAYGYRTYYSAPRSADPPIISADRSPSKVVPAATADGQSGKSLDRIGGKIAEERVVPHQEEPVAVADLNSRGLPAASFGAPAGAKAPVPAAAASTGVPTEPKKVRTVAIKPDGPDPVARPMVNPGSTSAGQDMPAAPAASTRPAPGSKPVPQAGRASPLSLEPRPQVGETASAYQTAPRETVPVAPAPKLASASPAGGYMVQLSSQRSEVDAQASFRSLQAKFPRELGEREATVRRADLGPKGIYYRAMVGPFGAAADADQFCNGLKAAGGQCIVQKN
jgi:hypothetical protein